MDKRTALAFTLMLLVFFAYVWVQEKYFTPPPPPRPTQETPPHETPPAPPSPAPPEARSAPTPPPPLAAPERRPTRRPPQRTAPVEAPLYRGVVSSEGGKLLEWTLHYRGDKPMVVLGERGPSGLILSQGSRIEGEPVPLELPPTRLTLGRGQPEGALPLKGDETGLNVLETLKFRADTYTVDVFVRLENTGPRPRAVSVALPWVARPPAKGADEKFPGERPTDIVWFRQEHVERINDLTAVGDRQPMEGAWIGLESTYYLAALIPQTPGFKLVAAGDIKPSKDGEVTGRALVAVTAEPTIAPGAAWEGRVLMYIGPKEYDRLKALGLEQTLNFGGFLIPESWTGGRPVLPMSWLGVPILQFMNFLYHYTGNYGVAIILLTVLSKVLLYPLSLKSMQSMKKMQLIQPQVNTLRNKYKNDPQRLQRETLELYRKHGVNPMGGCLPMVAQIPIFYALYLALSVSVELQNAPFLCFGRLFGVDLWVCDLAGHDPTYILPILMGLSMFVQQKMTPTMGDPRQAKIMMIVMPVVFTFMFLNLPSGLVLYWFVSNVLQILQQWLMDRPKSRGPKAREVREVEDAARA